MHEGGGRVMPLRDREKEKERHRKYYEAKKEKIKENGDVIIKEL